MDYNFTEIEKKWQQYWHDNKIYKVDIDHNKPKFYVLDMFPYFHEVIRYGCSYIHQQM